MRINKINIAKSQPNNDGLEEIQMSKLGQVVLVAGKNGSGKTRVLNKILGSLSSKPTSSQVENAKTELKYTKARISNFEAELNLLKTQLNKAQNQPQIDSINKNIQDYESAIKSDSNSLVQKQTLLDFDIIQTSELAENYKAVHFVPKNLKLDDCNNFNKTQIIQKANSINAVGINYLPSGTFAKIQVIQDRLFNATHPNSQIPKEDKDKAINQYKFLDELVFTFLNTNLGRTIDGEATLFGFALGKSQLSDGQKVLLQFCLAIYSQGTALKDLILMLDEPENHLHPSVIIETIDRIAECVPNGQIWIATHSIPLLAHYDPSLLWFVENGKIGYAGRIPEKVLSSLLGDENEIDRLKDFISLPSQFASSRYAFESLLDPKTVETDSTDPQTIQIREELLSLSNNGKIRILDFGAGKGRLISNLLDLDDENIKRITDQVDYIAYDPDNKDQEECTNSISRAYSDSANRYFNTIDDILTAYDKESFHVVIMCNVLHEIDPKDWLKLFSTDGIVARLLSDNGVLLLVEDHQLSVGEKAYQKGFLVLDTPQLKDLFKITEGDSSFSFVDARGDGRLKAHQIPKDCLLRIDADSRIESMKSLCLTARDKILEIRTKDKNYKNGKIHGFWVQQFANAQLNLSEFTSK